jgi:hypothetical protein
MWKPTYRVVLPPTGKGKALLQGWAVVDNVSGEDWRSVKLGLTSGAPIAFRYDLHTPRDVERSDLTESGVRKRAAVAMGETTYKEEPAPAQPPASTTAAVTTPEAEAGEGRNALDSAPKEKNKGDYKREESKRGATRSAHARPAPDPNRPPQIKVSRAPSGAPATEAMPEQPSAPPPAVDIESLRRSTLAQARAAAVSGLTRFALDQQITVRDGSSTMVAVINLELEGEETFLFRPGGAGMGYESNPYRVVRFKTSLAEPPSGQSTARSPALPSASWCVTPRLATTMS